MDSEAIYTTRSWVTGIGVDKGLKVVTKAVGSVTAGKELWFPNSGLRQTTGTPGTNDPPTREGDYWTSDAYLMWFNRIYPAGTYSTYPKLYGFSVRCVR